jgi:hypothetical protein
VGQVKWQKETGLKVLEEIGFGRKLLRDIPKPSSKTLFRKRGFTIYA